MGRKKMHFDLLEDRAVKGAENVKLGTRYLRCHVPNSNPYDGNGPAAYEHTFDVPVQMLSHYEMYPPAEPWDPEGKSRIQIEAHERLLQKSPVVGKKCTNFRGQEYVSWMHLADLGVLEASYNYLLDLDALEAEGIEVLRTTSIEYVESGWSKHTREMEDEMYYNLHRDYPHEDY